jgi:hypothetical protein
MGGAGGDFGGIDFSKLGGAGGGMPDLGGLGQAVNPEDLGGDDDDEDEMPALEEDKGAAAAKRA